MVASFLAAEVHYSRQQQGGLFYVVSEPLAPVLRIEAASPPPVELLTGMIWGPGTEGAPAWCAICPESMDWSFIVESDGPFFLKPV
ncbi:hypothetical protein D7V80_26510 [Corallococcus sp. CA054B]|nr:hypothetical protein D7V80_26510 [Corallococcus sp. CA054B]